MAVRINVTSQVTEGDNLRNIRIEKATTNANVRWIDFLRFHGVIVNEAHKYCIKSSRHVACMDDLIQDTASWYYRSKIYVKIVNRNSPGGAKRGRPRGRNVARTGFDGQQQQHQRNSVGGSGNVPPSPRQLSIADGELPGQQTEEDTESVASPDSQPADDQYSAIKKSFLERAASVRNVDFQAWQNELSKVNATGNAHREYRFKRKIPMLSIFLFGWADEMKKKRKE